MLVQSGVQSLGDRVAVHGVTISDQATIGVDMTIHGPNDPLCCPTQRVETIFMF